MEIFALSDNKQDKTEPIYSVYTNRIPYPRQPHDSLNGVFSQFFAVFAKKAPESPIIGISG